MALRLSSNRRRARLLMALGAPLVLVVSGLVTAPDASAEEVPVETPERGNLVLIADSYAGGTSTPELTMWFDRITTDADLTLRRYSQAGSGVLKTGMHCATGGTTYGQRLGAIAEDRPEIVIVEDVVNDNVYCSGGVYARASDSRIRANMKSFLTSLARRAQAANVERSKVYIVMPQTQKTRKYAWIGEYAKSRARVHRFTFVAPYLTRNETVADNVHLNARGQVRLAEQLEAAMGLEPRP